jgi:hypothetical protein
MARISKEAERKELKLGFPEPYAFFRLSDSANYEKISLFDKKSKESLINKAQEIVSSVHISRLPKHGGRLPSQREITEARKAQSVRIDHLPYEVNRIILESDPDQPLYVTITRSASFTIEEGQRLSEEEIAWREFLISEGLTHLWEEPLLPVAREFFLVRVGKVRGNLEDLLKSTELKQLESDSKFKVLFEKMNAYIRRLQPKNHKAKR